MQTDVLAFDRRSIPRRPIAGRAMAVFSSSNAAGTLVRVELIDASWQGIGIKSPIEVAPGASVSITPEDSMWPRQIGIVVRCEKDGEGYRLGLRSRLAKAAA
jgi:hypothetical protein